MRLNQEIFNQISSKKGQIAILVDPDKFDFSKKEEFIRKVKFAQVDYLFVGGSTVEKKDLAAVVSFLKREMDLPVVLFPGDVHQYDEKADAILYLSLLSGRNSDYLIGQHVRTAKEIAQTDLEIIPTAYLLIDGGNSSAVAYVSQTTPMPQDQLNLIENTVIAGILQGKSLVYLDAGSGAKNVVSTNIIERIALQDVPLIIGGGIRTIEQITAAKNAGANVIVIGNYIEENVDFLLDIAFFKSEHE